MTFTLPEALTLTPEQVATQIEEYKYLHQHPELSHQEFETTNYLQTQFEALELGEGIRREIHRVGETGLVLVLKNGEGPIIGYRADTDGLPVLEDTGLDYASVATTMVDGAPTPLMHACGHDSHMAVALATARLFAANPAEWSGTLVFILQPAEETGSGAQRMLDDGLWDIAPRPKVIFGQHVLPAPKGHFLVSAGEFMAASDSYDVKVFGQGGHGSQPESTIDPIVLGASMITRLQTIVSREVAPLDSVVVTVGTFHGGTKNNIIPDSATFTLNIRTFNPATRQKVLDAVHRIIRGEALVAGAPEPEITAQPSFPPTINDPVTTAHVQEVIKGALGEQFVIADDSMKLMGSEDFSLLATALGVPYTYWGFGGFSAEAFAAGTLPSNHSPFFAPDPDITLEAATRAATAVLLDALKN